MPEGDTIHYAAMQIRAVLEGHVPDEIATPHRRFARDRWPERLAGQAVRKVDAIGKHLLIRFEGGLTIHSHLRMTGSWRVLPVQSEWPRSPRAAWLVMRTGQMQVIQFHGPVLELMTDSRTRLDRRIAGLGPDIVSGPGFDMDRVLRRVREDDPTRPIGDTLLDQRIVAGIGNLWKCEGCWRVRLDPWRPAGKVTDEEIVAMIEATRPLMQESARTGNQDKHKLIYGNGGRPCPRCGPESRIEQRGQWDDNRLTYWCPRCQT